MYLVKSTEINKLPKCLGLQKRSIINEYDLKVDAKLQNLEFLRSLIIQNRIKEENKKGFNIIDNNKTDISLNNSTVHNAFNTDSANSNSLIFLENRDRSNGSYSILQNNSIHVVNSSMQSKIFLLTNSF